MCVCVLAFKTNIFIFHSQLNPFLSSHNNIDCTNFSLLKIASFSSWVCSTITLGKIKNITSYRKIKIFLEILCSYFINQSSQNQGLIEQYVMVN